MNDPKNVAVKLFNEGSNVTGMFFDKAHFTIWNANLKRREFRLEFNPNKLTSVEEEYLKTKVLPFLKNLDLSRMDIAFDCDFDLSKFNFLETKNPKKKTMIFGRSGELETLYLGMRGSEEQIRVYNKKKEMEEQQFEETNLPHWWRLEFQFRRDAKTDILHAKRNDTPFDNLAILHFDLSSIRDIQTRSLIYYFTNDPQAFSDITDRRAKKKYKELLVQYATENVTNEFVKKYKQKKSDLRYKVTQWLETCSSRSFK